MRQTTFVFLLVAAVLSLGVFVLKYQVTDLENEVTALDRRIVATREAIHVLEAEWSYLNEPERLRRLAVRYLGLVPVMPTDLGTFEGLHAWLRGSKPISAPASPPRAWLAAASPIGRSAERIAP